MLQLYLLWLDLPWLDLLWLDLPWLDLLWLYLLWVDLLWLYLLWVDLPWQAAQAEAVLRELCTAAPPLLRATLTSWGDYSPTYCRLEQLWIEAYAGMVSAMVAQQEADAKRREGLAMAHSLYSLLAGMLMLDALPIPAPRLNPNPVPNPDPNLDPDPNPSPDPDPDPSPNLNPKLGRMQFRFLRHAVADWALALAPASARSLFMKGEAILEQPLPGQAAVVSE